MFRARLDEYGFATQLLHHDAYISLPGRSLVQVDNATLRCITHSFSRAAPEGVRGRLVHVGAGSDADFAGRDVRGCIVLVDGIATPPVSLRASRAGAIGQLHISPHEHLHEMCISPVWGNPSAETVGELPSTVVCSVLLSDGTTLRERLARGEQPAVMLQAEVDTGWRKTPILVADLNVGDDAPFVLFSGHHDTWHYGVMDNGSANASMLEVARLCAGQRDSGSAGCGCASGRGTRMGAIPVRPGMSMSTGTNSIGGAWRISTSTRWVPRGRTSWVMSGR